MCAPPSEPVTTASAPNRRHDLHRSIIQKAVTKAARAARLTKRMRCHTLRHSFATHLLGNGYDIRTVQELLGHKDVAATMIFSHVLNQTGGRGVHSPYDALRTRQSPLGLPISA